jgi:hypothetical protein
MAKGEGSSMPLNRRILVLFLALAAAGLGAGSVLFGVCGPFTDVSDAAFCPFVLEIFTLGITTGTSPTTYDPSSSVTRLQMAAFLSRSVDGVLQRSGRRALVKKFWTPQNKDVLKLTTVGIAPLLAASDGIDVWVANAGGGGTVSRVRGSDGKLLEAWTGAASAYGVLAAMGQVFVTGQETPGKLYRVNPSQPAGAVTTVASNLGGNPVVMAFDGARIWTANGNGSASIATVGASLPWSVTTVTVGSNLFGALFDGANVWVTDNGLSTLIKLDAGGAILQTVTIAPNPEIPTFDGTNIWVPHGSSAVSVVRASSGAVLATLTGNGLNLPYLAAFDGQRVLVTNNSGNSVSLWKAADLTPLGSFSTGAASSPFGACSDGINFWIVLTGPQKLARF